MADNNTRQKILIGVLGIVIIYYLIDTFVLNTSQVDQAAEKSNPPAGVTSITDDFIQIASVTPLKWDGAWEKDPFFYVSRDTAAGANGVIDQLFGQNELIQTTRFDLTGISWLGNSGYAIINGSIVKEGEMIKGYKVEQVAMDYVVLKQGIKTIRLALND